MKWRFILNTVLKFVAPFGGEEFNCMRHYYVDSQGRHRGLFWAATSHARMKHKYDCAKRQVVQLVVVVLSLILTRVRDPVLQTTSICNTNPVIICPVFVTSLSLVSNTNRRSSGSLQSFSANSGYFKLDHTFHTETERNCSL